MNDAAHLFSAELSDFGAALAEVNDDAGLYDLQVVYLGKKGRLTLRRGEMGSLGPDDRRAFGQAFNEAKGVIEAGLSARRAQLADLARDRDLRRTVDLSVFASPISTGSLHVVTQTWRRIEDIFLGMGFDVVDGPHVEHEAYNFDALNIPAEHPARDMQDTFFVNLPTDGVTEAGVGSRRPLVLRTHTSPVQIRTMLQRPPPVRIVALGSVFRKDDDATHSPMFHQIEGLFVDRGVGMADLKATLYEFVGALFESEGLEIRFRPSYFPFVEPGAEFDVSCPFCRARGCATCKRSGFIELGGAGMVHPAVFEAVGYDPEVYTGWAFGFGIDRIAMLLHAIPDLRLLFDDDLRFLEQFPC